MPLLVNRLCRLYRKAIPKKPFGIFEKRTSPETIAERIEFTETLLNAGFDRCWAGSLWLVATAFRGALDLRDHPGDDLLRSLFVFAHSIVRPHNSQAYSCD